MRLLLVGAVVSGLAAALSGCAAPGDTAPFGFGLSRVDPQEAAERAIVGAAVGTALGTGLGATFAINPAVGSIIGAESGAAIGAAVGVATAQPLPSYAPIAVPALPVIPHFYDTWPPGYYPPPVAAQTPPPRPS
jgi:hypothetical protein